MNKDELKAKYGRIANDPSQLEIFKDDVIDGEVSGLPDLPEDASEKDYVLALQNGEMVWSEGGIGPTPTGEIEITANGEYDVTEYATANVNVSAPRPELVEKGDIIFMNHKRYKVLSANADNTDVKLMLIDKPNTAYKYYDYNTPVQYTEFNVTGDKVINGVKYENSLLDQAIQSFVSNLPQTIQDAMIEEEMIQEIWADDSPDSDAWLFTVLGTVYRLKKIGQHETGVLRKAHQLSFSEALTYIDKPAGARSLAKEDFYDLLTYAYCTTNTVSPFTTSVTGAAYMSDCQTSVGASTGSTSNRMMLFKENGEYDRQDYDFGRALCPVFRIDLTQVDYAV